MVQLLWKPVGQFPKNLNVELPHDPAIPLQDIYSKVLKTGTETDTCAPMHNVHCGINHNSQKLETTQCPSTDK